MWKWTNLLCVTYAPKRIHIEAISEPNINIKPMKSQTRAPAGNIKTSENHVEYYPQWQLVQLWYNSILIQHVTLLKAQRERIKPCIKGKTNQNVPSLVKHIVAEFPLFQSTDTATRNFPSSAGNAYNITSHNLEWTNDGLLCQSYSVSEVKTAFQQGT